MTFLAPAAGLIAAAIAIPALLFFYLLKLRRRPVRVSSTLLWHKATHDLQVNAPLRWPRLTWLFLLQLLALLAFLTALARPAIEGGGPVASRVVLVIDRSASMSARDGRGAGTGDGGTRLDEAKARAIEVIDRLRYAGGSRRARAMVVALGADARAVTGFTDSTAALRDAVRGIAPSDQPGDLRAALRMLGSLSAGQGEEEETERERTAVYIFSDGSFRAPAAGGPFTAPGAGAMDVQLVAVGPRGEGAGAAEGESAAAQGPVVDNLGIVAISARRDHEDPVIARIFVRVQNSGAEAVSTLLQLRVGGELVDSRGVEVPGRGEGGAAGQAAATFEVNRPSGGLAVVSFIRSDVLEADNAAAVVLGEPTRPGVLVVAPGADADPFLMSVLDVMDLRRLLVVDPDGYETRARGGGDADEAGVGGLGGAGGFDVVMFDRVRPQTLPALPTISFGAGLPIPGLSVSAGAGEGGEGTDGGTPAGFLAWRRTHPVLRYVSLDPIVIDPPMLVSLPPEAGEERAEPAVPEAPVGDTEIAPGSARPTAPVAPAAAPVTASVSLAEGPMGPLVGLVEQGATRRIVVGFELARSTWGPDVSFPVFMANAVEYLTLRGESAAGRSFTTGEPITVTPAPGAATVTISGPMAATVEVPETASGEGVRRVPIGVLERVGVYSVDGVAPADSVLAVNLVDDVESTLATAGALDIAGGTGTGGPGEAENGAEAGPREIWHWFVVLGLVLASVEWMIYAWRMRP